MKDYLIYTDSACDIKPELLAEWKIPYRSLTLRFADEEYQNNEISADEFYKRMRAGGVAKTAAVNSEAFKEEFKKLVDQGYDVLYIGFSSGLSTTFNSARIAANELKEEYPDARIEVVDTLSASAGFGLLLYLVYRKKNEGASIDEAKEYALSLVPKMCHWFTVDDLVYLQRGGRISKVAAFVGTALGVKPVLHMDDAGHLIARSKVRGRRNAIVALADKYGELADDKEGGTVFISHADCIDDAKLLEKMLADRFGAKVSIITDVGPVIGAHSGPGTLALFFVGKNR
jgi:DegV family protein with EDD domain